MRRTKDIKLSFDYKRYKPSSSCSPSYTFSKLDRFNSDVFEKFKNMSSFFILNKSSPKRSSLYFNTKKVQMSSPEEKLKKIREFSKKEELKAEINRITRNRLLSSLNKEKSSKLSEKFNRFELRKNKREVVRLKRAWILLIIPCGVAYAIKKLIQNRKILKYRSKKTILWLLGICKCLGRIMLKFKRLRKRMSFTKLIILGKYAKRWVSNRKKLYKNSIITCVENTIDNSLMTSVMYQWKEKILFIQRSLKTWLKIRRIVYRLLLEKWDAAEKEFIDEKQRKKERKRVKKIAFKEEKKLSTSLFPSSIKTLAIKTKVKSILRNYKEEVKEYISLIKTYLRRSPTLEIESVIRGKSNFRPKLRIIDLVQEVTKEMLIEMIQTTFSELFIHKANKY